MASVTEKESGKTRMVVIMLVSTKMINHLGKAYTSGKMARAMKVSGRMVFSMERESRNYQMERSSMAPGTWVCQEDSVCASTQMVVRMTVTGSMDNLMG